MAAGPSTRSAGDEQAGHLRGRRREVGQREARRVGGGRGLGVRSAHPPVAARGLVTWGAPRWPPKPPNRVVPLNPSITRQAPGPLPRGSALSADYVFLLKNGRLGTYT